MSDYSKAIGDSQASGSALHGDKAGPRAQPDKAAHALGPFGPTRAPQPVLDQNQGGSAAQPSGAKDPGDVGGYVGPTGPATLIQGAADAQQHSEPGGGTLPAVSRPKLYGPQA